jgi:hypothetical protein
MSLSQAVPIRIGGVVLASDSPYNGARDAFGRFRVSEPETIFDSKQLYTNQPLYFDDAATAGSGTSSTHSAARASTTIGVSNLTLGTRVRQSLRWLNYQPGKSQLVFATFVMGAAATGITRRVGLFETNNGLFLQQTSTGLSLVRRTYVTGSPVDNAVAQASWNIDPLDGSGPSRITLDMTKSQILVIDFEWLGVGSIRFGFVINGVIYYVHQMQNANVLNAVYMSTPNLPIRYEISNSGTGPAATLECICAQVSSEGGRTQTGLDFSVDRGSTGLVTLNDADVYPLLAIRLQSGRQGATIIPSFVSIVCTSTSTFRWALLLNPTVAGTALSFSAVTNSNVEADVARTNGSKVTGGTQLVSGYSQQQNEGGVTLTSVPDFALGTTIAGVSDIIVVAVQRITGTTETFYGSMSWHEAV